MCGRFVQTLDEASLHSAFSLHLSESSPVQGYNLAPGRDISVIVQAHEQRVLERREWGLVPQWAKPGFRGLINARAETLAEKPAFRQALRRRRCLIPASGFYEWKTEGRRKMPFYILSTTGRPLAFAGIWETWENPELNLRKHSVAIITVAANAWMRPLHERMPALLEEPQRSFWLSEEQLPAEKLLEWLRPGPEDFLQRWPVSVAVNSTHADAPELIRPESPSPEPPTTRQLDLFD